MKIIETENLKQSYQVGEQQISVIKGIDLVIEEKEFVAIMGKSGCGKTTLLKSLGMIQKPTEGKLFFKETDTSFMWGDALADVRRNEIGFVFQDFYLMDAISVKENIMLPMILNQEGVGPMMERVLSLAKCYEIEKLLEKYPYQLSGGEKQRVAICRALMNNPELILADEPTGNLDSKSGKIVMESLQEINKTLGKTIVMVTHDPQMASQCKRVIFLKDGEILGQEMEYSFWAKKEFYQKILEWMDKI